jgi:LIM-domain binding protein
MSFWLQFAKTHFNDAGEVFFMLQPSDPTKKGKLYKIVNSLIPRFFWQQFNISVENIQLILEGTSENTNADGSTSVTTDRAKMIFSYREGYQVCVLYFRVLRSLLTLISGCSRWHSAGKLCW